MMTQDQITAGHLAAFAQAGPVGPVPFAGLEPVPGEPSRVPAAVRRLTGRVWHSWPVFLARYYSAGTWRAMPGPWPVKLALIAVCQVIPGQADELILVAVTQAFRARKARQMAR